MRKSTAVVLGLLIVISSTYYLTFWSYFDIDVFQYMNVSDIVKGLIYPLRDAVSTLLFTLCYLFMAIIYVYWSERNQNNSKVNTIDDYSRRIGILTTCCVISILLAAAAVAVYILAINDEQMHYAVSSGIVVLPTVSLAVVLAYCVVDNKIMLDDFREGNKDVFKIKNSFFKAIDYFIVAITTYLFASALIYGTINAKKVERHIAYDYVLDNSFLEKEGMCVVSKLVYLGEVNDKCFFKYYDTKSYLVVDKWKVPVLLLAHYELRNADMDLLPLIVAYFANNIIAKLILVLSLGPAVSFFLIKAIWNKFVQNLYDVLH